MNRWAPIDHRYRLPPGLAEYASRPAYKWTGLLIAWVLVTAVLSITHLGVLLLVIMAGLICYVVYTVLRDTPPARRGSPDLPTADQITDRPRPVRRQFNAPPGWPDPPPGWEPPPGWQPHRSWPAAPPGWEFWVWPYDAAHGQRVGRYRRTDSTRYNGT